MNILSTPPSATGIRVPATDIHETPELVRLCFNVPGAAPEDLVITFENKTLTIAGKTVEGAQRPPVYQRSIAIPRDLDSSAMKAALRHGVLEIELPKVKTPAAVAIPIRS